jgi:hypothetical protein
MYLEVIPGKTTLCDIDARFLSDWNKSIFFHGNEPNALCAYGCSFMFLYPVPKFFSRGRSDT